MHPSGRGYIKAYENVRRREHHELIEHAVARSGGRVLWSSGPTAGPLFLAVRDHHDREFGLVAYVFRASRILTRNRPTDEHKLQIRYGSETSWHTQRHPLGRDPVGLDVTVVLGVEPDADVVVGLDPRLYDPIPMGISIFWKDGEARQIGRRGWHAWERDNLSGTQRAVPRSADRVETLVGFRPDRLLDYVELEREATALRLDPPLRLRSAERALARRHRRGAVPAGRVAVAHALADQYELSPDEILDIIGERSRLAMAVRGGVAEHHLGKTLRDDPEVRGVRMGEAEGPPDYHVSLRSGRRVTVECKNAARDRTKDGLPKVEVQKTRASKSDPASRFYSHAAFDVIAACMYGPTGTWTFRFKRSAELVPHKKHPARIAPIQHIDRTWSATLAEAVRGRRS